MLKKLKHKLKKFLFRHMEEYEITLEELKEKQLDGAEIIDVRSNTEYNESHVEGSINLPENEIENKIEQIINDKNKLIVLYCASGIRSTKAYNKLKNLGYTNLYTLYGGMQNY